MFKALTLTYPMVSAVIGSKRFHLHSVCCHNFFSYDEYLARARVVGERHWNPGNRDVYRNFRFDSRYHWSRQSRLSVVTESKAHFFTKRVCCSSIVSTIIQNISPLCSAPRHPNAFSGCTCWCRCCSSTSCCSIAGRLRSNIDVNATRSLRKVTVTGTIERWIRLRHEAFIFVLEKKEWKHRWNAKIWEHAKILLNSKSRNIVAFRKTGHLASPLTCSYSLISSALSSTRVGGRRSAIIPEENFSIWKPWNEGRNANDCRFHLLSLSLSYRYWISIISNSAKSDIPDSNQFPSRYFSYWSQQVLREVNRNRY